jgi:hypothetical protein
MDVLDRFKPVATDPFEKLAEIFQYYKGDTIQFLVKRKEKGVVMTMEMKDIRVHNTNGIEGLENIISLADYTNPINALTIWKEDILELTDNFFWEEASWRKDGYKVEFKNGMILEFDVLD